MAATPRDGLQIGYAKANKGRVYHVVEVRRVESRREPDPVTNEPIVYYRNRVERALCGNRPCFWEHPVTRPVPNELVHKACRAFILETATS